MGDLNVSSNVMYSDRESELLQDILHLVITKYPSALSLFFASVTPDKVDALVDALVTLSFARSTTLGIIRHFVVEEFERHKGEPDANTLFRENGTAAKIVKTYLLKVGHPLLSEMLSYCVNEVCVRDKKVSYEVDPAKLESAEDLEANKKLLVDKVELFLSKITSQSAVDKMPQGIRTIASFFSELSAQYFPKVSPGALVGGFLMLRYINPAIFAPEQYDLLPQSKVVSAKSRRNLILISKVLQNLSNGVQFNKKEQYMTFLNSFIDLNVPRMQHFFKQVVIASASCSRNLVCDSDLCVVSVKELHLLHRALFQNKDELLANILDDDSKREFLAKMDALGSYSSKVTFANALNDYEQGIVKQVLERYHEEASFIGWIEVKKKNGRPQRCILVIGMNRIFLIRPKASVPGRSLVKREGHSLDLTEIISHSPKDVALVFKSFTIAGETEQADEIIYCIRRAFLNNFSGIPEQYRFRLNIAPASRIEDIRAPDSQPCGGFVGSYKALCDYYGVPVNMALCWDIQTLYASNTTFDLKLYFNEETGDISSTSSTSDLVPIFKALRYNAFFTTLIMDGYKLQSTATSAALCEALTCNSSLTSLSLANTGLSDRTFAGIFEAMASNPKCSITTLNLNNNEMDERSITALSQYIVAAASHTTTGIVRLNLQNACSNARAIVTLAASFEFAMKTKGGVSELQFLDLSYTKISDAAPTLAHWILTGGGNAIKFLNIGHSSATNQTVSTVLLALTKHCKSLEVLDISGLRIVKPEDVGLVAQTICMAPNLRSVNLSGCVASVSALNEVLKAPRQEAPIHLNLSCNTFSFEGIRVLQSLVPKISCVRSLDLSDTDLGDDGVFLICEGLTLNTCVTSLNINGCFKIDRRPRYETQLQKNILPFLQALASNKTLTSIDLSEHQFGNSGAISLAKTLMLNTSLTSVMLDENQISISGLTALCQSLKENETLRVMPLPILDITAILAPGLGGAYSQQKRVKSLCDQMQLCESLALLLREESTAVVDVRGAGGAPGSRIAGSLSSPSGAQFSQEVDALARLLARKSIVSPSLPLQHSNPASSPGG
eukprot:m51a1_g12165 hypothetical protein (1068) ;mRNA; r:88-4311